MSRSECELLVRGGTVVDGSGAPGRAADVAVDGDRISAVGRLDSMRGAREVDAAGLVVAPGFIDTHTHDDRAVLSDPGMACKASQGVTTVVTGNCGVSLAPLTGREPPPPLNLLGGPDWYRFPTFAAYREELEGAPPAVNVAMQAGHSALRASVMDDGRLDRAATAAEVERMVELADEAMRAGCIGFSTGLAYPPAKAAPTEEVVAIAARVAAHGGMHSTHMRDEEGGVLDSVRETVRIGREAGLPVVISHHKCAGRENWGRTRETLALIEEAQAHQAVDLDVYPYVAGSTVLLREIAARSEKVIVSWSEPHPQAAGRALDEVARELGCEPLEAVERLKPGGGIYFMMDEEDLERILRFPGAMIGSDGLPHDVFPHPRLWGTFPRVLGRFVRERGVLGLEDAVHRMTGKPAAVFGLEGRGAVREGAFADLVLFDPATVIDAATFEDPVRPAPGIRSVLVNGREVWTEGAPPAAASAGAGGAARPGRLLRRAQQAA